MGGASSLGGIMISSSENIDDVICFFCNSNKVSFRYLNSDWDIKPSRVSRYFCFIKTSTLGRYLRSLLRNHMNIAPVIKPSQNDCLSNSILDKNSITGIIQDNQPGYKILRQDGHCTIWAGD
jgi:hypothetical protein